MPITDSGLPHPYGDTPSPKVFGRVSPLDPAMFSPVNEFVDELIKGQPSGRYSPADVANGWKDSQGFERTDLPGQGKKFPTARDADFPTS